MGPTAVDGALVQGGPALAHPETLAVAPASQNTSAPRRHSTTPSTVVWERTVSVNASSHNDPCSTMLRSER